jgi:proteasome lid subunit RPN8/RPN11
MNPFIQNLITKGILRTKTVKGAETLVFTRTKTVTITKDIQERIKARYPESREIGGVVSVKFTNEGYCNTTDVFFFDNTQTDPSKYSPNYQQYHKAIATIIAREELPLFFHTHPTKLGISSYDGRRASFYLTSSIADEDASFFPLSVGNTELILPSLIFVSDKRFNNGLGVSMYGGYIFPLSYAKLSQQEITSLWILGVMFLLFTFLKKLNVLKGLGVLAGCVIVYYLYTKPSYKQQINGDIQISV